jgi:ribosomal protein S18 acetylase RimI-like enzyme
MSVTIRAGRPSDAEIVAEFNRRMALETEKVRLEPATILAGCRAVLGDAARGLYFVAEIDGRVVGQIMVTREWSDWRNGDIWWIQSVYVHPDYRRRGVFRALYRHVEQEARRSGVVSLRLYVEQDNTAAQATYRALGMKLCHYRVMEQPLGGSGCE